MTNHYVSELLDSFGIILYVLQRLGVIDVGTQAITASHNAKSQFCLATVITGTYQCIILNKWLMPCAFPGTQNE